MTEKSIQNGLKAFKKIIALNGNKERGYRNELRHFRHDRPRWLSPCIYEPSIALILQGQKKVIHNNRELEYGPGSLLLTSLDVPVISAITEASPEIPYISLLLKLDRQVFAEYLHQIPLPEQECIGDFRPLSIWRVDGDLLDIFMKMEEACVSDTLGSLLMPLLKKEMAIRLLAGRYGMDIRKALHATTSAGKISCAIEWLKGNYVEPFNVQTLANKAFMSVSTFRQYFRHVTGLSPLQYQKSLRLIEARKLMLSGEVDATHASMSVGYESISQFNREYRRMFGQPPMRDIRSIKGSNLF